MISKVPIWMLGQIQEWPVDAYQMCPKIIPLQTSCSIPALHNCRVLIHQLYGIFAMSVAFLSLWELQFSVFPALGLAAL